MQIEIDAQAEKIANKVRHYLITTMGRTALEANADEFYRAFCYALREEVMVNWHATTHTYTQGDVRTLYYLSMEYLPGRIFSNNVTNLSSKEIIGRVLQKLDRRWADVASREADPGLGNGGLGRLASCFLDSLATQHYPVYAYGLRYQYGIFEQQLWNGQQIEAPDCWLLSENPWEYRRDLKKATVKYCGQPVPAKNIHGDEIFDLKECEQVWALPYDIPIIGYKKGDEPFSVVTLRLWSSKESPRNFQLQRYNAGRIGQAAENTTLTDVLYPSDYHEMGKRIRLKQEFLLVSASLQDIIAHYLNHHENFRDFADKVRIQINDTHPTLVIPELIRILIKVHDIPWNTAVKIAQTCVGYTNHTILKEALEEWDRELFAYLLPRQYHIIERLNHELCQKVRERFPNDEERVQRMSILEGEKVRMANLAVAGAHSVNGVAALHTDILKKSVFKDFYELSPDKFLNITNGVTQRRWLLHANPNLASFITKRIGDGWITDFAQIAKIADHTTDEASLEEFLDIKRKNKERLIDYLYHNDHLRDAKGEILGPPPVIETQSLFDVQIKRVHEYKRQLLCAIHLIMLYQEISKNPQTHRIPRTVIFSGKAAASYDTAKHIIQLICAIARKINKDPACHNLLKVLFVENYNVSKAEMIIPAAELSEQISTAGTEASGTGNMKLAINGALTIGTHDGANIEMQQQIGKQWWPFEFGCSAEQIAEMKIQNSYIAKEIYQEHPEIKKALDTLTDGTFAKTEEEQAAFQDLYGKLIESHYGGPADQYFILKDLPSYFETQKAVEQLYKEPLKWAEYALHNIAGMGFFSTDRSIDTYCDKVWGIQPCPPDPEIIQRVQAEYSRHDQCRIY